MLGWGFLKKRDYVVRDGMALSDSFFEGKFLLSFINVWLSMRKTRLLRDQDHITKCTNETFALDSSLASRRFRKTGR